MEVMYGSPYRYFKIHYPLLKAHTFVAVGNHWIGVWGGLIGLVTLLFVSAVRDALNQ